MMNLNLDLHLMLELGSYIQFLFKIYFSSFFTLSSLIPAWNEALFNGLFVSLGMLYFGLFLSPFLVLVCVCASGMHPWSRLCSLVLHVRVNLLPVLPRIPVGVPLGWMLVVWSLQLFLQKNSRGTILWLQWELNFWVWWKGSPLVTRWYLYELFKKQTRWMKWENNFAPVYNKDISNLSSSMCGREVRILSKIRMTMRLLT